MAVTATQRRRLAVTSLALMTSCSGKGPSLKLKRGSSPQTSIVAISLQSKSKRWFVIAFAKPPKCPTGRSQSCLVFLTPWSLTNESGHSTLLIAEFKRTWEGLSDEHRAAFVQEFNIDISDLQRSLVEQSSTGNAKPSPSLRLVEQCSRERGQFRLSPSPPPHSLP